MTKEVVSKWTVFEELNRRTILSIFRCEKVEKFVMYCHLAHAGVSKTHGEFFGEPLFVGIESTGLLGFMKIFVHWYTTCCLHENDYRYGFSISLSMSSKISSSRISWSVDSSFSSTWFLAFPISFNVRISIATSPWTGKKRRCLVKWVWSNVINLITHFLEREPFLGAAWSIKK